MRKMLHGAAFAFAILTAPLACSAPAATPLVTIDREQWTSEPIQAVAYDAVHKKVYAGLHSFDRQRRLLFVFDVETDGRVRRAPRRFVAHPTVPLEVASCAITTLKIDAQRRKLYMGVVDTQGKIDKCLVVYDLDPNGVPAGLPRAYASGNPRHEVQALVLHPTLPRLYVAGWGGAGVYAFNLDAAGEPVQPPKVFAVGGGGKYALAIRADGSRLYMGVHPSALEVTDLDAQGDIVGRLRTYAAPGGADRYLEFASNERGLYFKSADGKLAYTTFDAAGEPTGRFQTVTDTAVEAVDATADRLIATIPGGFTDAITGQWIADGVQVKEYALGADGAPGAVLATSPLLPRRKTSAFAAGAANILIASTTGDDFIGNRFTGLRLRASLTGIKPASTLPLMQETLDFHLPEERYLHFSFSPKFERVYAAQGTNIYVAAPSAKAAITTIAAPMAVKQCVVAEGAGLMYAAGANDTILVYKLDANGLPLPAPEVVATGINPIAALAVNPTTNQVYVAGKLAVEGKAIPIGKIVPLVATEHVTQLAVDGARGRVYGVSMYHDTQNLWVWTLAPDGTPAKAAVCYNDGLDVDAAGAAPRAREFSALALDAARRKLYTGGNPLNPTAGEGRIVVHDLDAAGDPVGAPRSIKSPNNGGSVWSLALSGGWLFESGFRDPRVFAHPLDKGGEPTGPPVKWTGSGTSKVSLTAVPGNRLLLGTYPGQLEIVPLHPGGEPVGGLSATFSIDQKQYEMGYLYEGSTTPWLSLDAALQGGVRSTIGTLGLKGAPLDGATVEFEIAQAAGTALKPLKTFAYEIAGNKAALILPRYGADESSDVAAMIRSSTEVYEGYRQIAQQVGLKPEERPRRFIVANGMMGMDSNLAALDSGLQTLGLLGHNTVQIWNVDVAPAALKRAIDRNGFSRYRGAIYTPPAYFDYDVPKVQPAFLDKWAVAQREFTSTMGASANDMVLFHMADEPGWYFPTALREVASNPQALGVFRKYLQDQKLTPQDLGGNSWNDIMPLGRGGADTLARRRLFYWTIRFFPEAMSRSFAAATAALQRNINPRLLTTTNLANWPARHYFASPGKTINKNPDVGPDTAMGMPDWFDLGRKKAVSCMWTEDWFKDNLAQTWSLYGDLLRCAAREGNLEYGGYIIGHTTESAAGGQYKIMALAGHGAKAFDPYMFGPRHVFVDGWSEKTPVYASIAAGMKLLGKSEKLLYPGRPRAGNVAILMPQASQVWDEQEPQSHYLNEIYGLHAALVHEQYPVDFVDDTGIEQGNLAKYRYSVLYVTAPNLSVKAQAAILAWVRAGGTVILGPGAAAADEYNEPTTLLWLVAGASRGAVPRLAAAQGEARTGQAAIVTSRDARLTAGAVATIDQVTPLQALPGGQALAQFGDGKAAVVVAAAGRGRVFSLGFWPGVSYWNSADRALASEIPQSWDAAPRQYITSLARLGGAAKLVVVDTAMVEAAVLESDAGMAITLLNWSGKPLPQIVVTLPANLTFSTIESVERGRLQVRRVGATLQVTLPLATVDVLMLAR